jgi:hypothetical protein
LKWNIKKSSNNPKEGRKGEMDNHKKKKTNKRTKNEIADLNPNLSIIP